MHASCDWKSLLAADKGFALWLDSGPGRAFGRLFVKEVARVGEWIHPGTGESVVFTRADLDEIAASTNRYAAAVNGIRFPNRHDGQFITGKQPNAEDNLGRWLSFYVDEQDRLMGVVEPGDAKVADMLGGRMRGVSLCLVGEVKDSHGNAYTSVLEHVAATPEPVLSESGNFLALSRAGASAEAAIPVLRLASAPPTKEPPTMPNRFLAIAAALSLAVEAMTDEQAEQAIVAKIKADKADKAGAAEKPGAAGKGCEGCEAAKATAMARTVEVTAFSARVAALETAKASAEAQVLALSKDADARSKADCDGAIAALATSAAASGKPEAFDAADQTFVRERWAKDRPAADRTLALARRAVGGTPAQLPAKGSTQAPDKALAAEKAKNDRETRIALARGTGCTIERVGDAVYAVRSDGVKVSIG